MQVINRSNASTSRIEHRPPHDVVQSTLCHCITNHKVTTSTAEGVKPKSPKVLLISEAANTLRGKVVENLGLLSSGF